MTLQPTDLGVSEMSREELDNIALQGGLVGAIGYGSDTRGELPAERHGYGFLWVNTQGMGNHGDLVLTPKSKEAEEKLREGRINQVAKKLGLETDEAEILVDAAKGVKYGQELNVLAYAWETREYLYAWDFFPGVGGGVWQWVEEWDMPESQLTAPRLEAVAKIVRRLASGE